MNYTINPNFNIDCGFEVNSQHIESVLSTTNLFLKRFPQMFIKMLTIKLQVQLLAQYSAIRLLM